MVGSFGDDGPGDFGAWSRRFWSMVREILEHGPGDFGAWSRDLEHGWETWSMVNIAVVVVASE